MKDNSLFDEVGKDNHQRVVNDCVVLRKLFKRIKAPAFFNLLLTVACGRPIIDVLEFDNWIHKHYGTYENEGMSMLDFIEKQFGKPFLEEFRRYTK